MAVSNNHVVRESAGQAFGELAIKVGRTNIEYGRVIGTFLESTIVPTLLQVSERSGGGVRKRSIRAT